jgi:hypothetical protein
MHNSMGQRLHCRKPLLESPKKTTKDDGAGYSAQAALARRQQGKDTPISGRLLPPSDRINFNHARHVVEYQHCAAGAVEWRLDLRLM